MRNAKSSAPKLRSIQLYKIISSDLGRAFTTAYLISRELGYTSEIELNKNLREVNYGDFANRPYSDLPTLPPKQYATYVPPNGESLTQMQQRVVAAVKVLAADNPNQAILLVGHDGTINAIRASFSDQDIGEADATSSPHDFVAKFVVDNDKVTSFEEI